MAAKKPIRIQLTEEQKQQIKKATGKDASTLEFKVDELEDRIAPFALDPGLE